MQIEIATVDSFPSIFVTRTHRDSVALGDDVNARVEGVDANNN